MIRLPILLFFALLQISFQESPGDCDSLELCDCHTEERESGDVLVMDCSHRGLTSVPSFRNYSVTIEILLNGNSISSLNNYAFKNVGNIRKINAANNSIESISAKAFKSLEESLEDLILANNTQLRELPAALKTLTVLARLDVSNIVLSTIEEGSNNPLANLRELRYLDLSYNSLDIPSDSQVYESLGNLRYVNLAEMGLSSIPTAIINNTPKLEQLIFRKNNLINYAESLSDAVPNLIELDLSKNPVSYQHTVSLFNGFSHLRILKVSGGELLKIADNTFNHVTKLTHLTFADLNIEQVHPNAFKLLTEIEYLDIGQNHFNLTDGLLDGMSATLQTLIISDMALTRFPKQLLSNMPQLRKVHLEENRISHLEQAQFGVLIRKNMEIYLSSNELQNIDHSVLEYAPIPLHLYLQNNNITELSFLIANECEFKDTTIDVTNNNILCDCATFSTVQLKVINLVGNCVQPSKYNGLRLSYAPVSDPSTSVSAAANNDQYLESVAMEDCSGEDRSKQHYSCSCHSWNTIGLSESCSVLSGSDPTNSAPLISWGTFIAFSGTVTMLPSLFFSLLVS